MRSNIKAWISFFLLILSLQSVYSIGNGRETYRKDQIEEDSLKQKIDKIIYLARHSGKGFKKKEFDIINDVHDGHLSMTSKDSIVFIELSMYAQLGKKIREYLLINDKIPYMSGRYTKYTMPYTFTDSKIKSNTQYAYYYSNKKLRHFCAQGDLNIEVLNPSDIEKELNKTYTKYVKKHLEQ